MFERERRFRAIPFRALPTRAMSCFARVRTVTIEKKKNTIEVEAWNTIKKRDEFDRAPAFGRAPPLSPLPRDESAMYVHTRAYEKYFFYILGRYLSLITTTRSRILADLSRSFTGNISSAGAAVYFEGNFSTLFFFQLSALNISADIKCIITVRNGRRRYRHHASEN